MVFIPLIVQKPQPASWWAARTPRNYLYRWGCLEMPYLGGELRYDDCSSQQWACCQWVMLQQQHECSWKCSKPKYWKNVNMLLMLPCLKVIKLGQSGIRTPSGGLWFHPPFAINWKVCFTLFCRTLLCKCKLLKRSAKPSNGYQKCISRFKELNQTRHTSRWVN